LKIKIHSALSRITNIISTPYFSIRFPNIIAGRSKINLEIFKSDFVR
jgi:hypothetical protein